MVLQKSLLALAAACIGFGAQAQSQAQTPVDAAALYASHCIACHQPEGEGTIGIAPAVAGTLAKRAATPEGRDFLAQILITGMSGPITSQGQRYSGNMPSFAIAPDTDLAAALNYVLETFNASPVRLTAENFAAARARPATPAEVRKTRERLVAQVGE
jgi:mono/diheme cytochrome c family protein